MLYVAKKMGHDTFITGLWGCGAFGANPENMAELWRLAIGRSKVRPAKVVFAMVVDSYSKSHGLSIEKIVKLFTIL
jgi:uncharacterized protein (TIGR02452 family)